ncbi:hypothetical protein [Actinoplanes sichuanensis]|uniref:Uncharacterized protein n=1 Tax=Actinoplanes sichuanensis TaxID=512349 RepID=A0ABW4A2N5_9ACTN|nr:hypothetical protein [Actinoplanes sichuanensis]
MAADEEPEPVPEPAEEQSTTDVEELEPQPIDAPDNSGQVASTVYGGMHQHFNEKLTRLRNARSLDADGVTRTLNALVGRRFTAFRQTLDEAGAEQVLRRHHHLVLIGEPRSGRRTAAIGILGRLGLPLQEIPAWDPAQPTQFTASDLPAGHRTGFLFIYPEGQPAATDFSEQLSDYTAGLPARESFLVIVVTAADWQRLDGTMAGNVLTVHAPDGRAVLIKELQSRAPGRNLRALLDDGRIRELLRRAAPQEAMRLADLIEGVIGTQGGTPDTPGWLDLVIDDVCGGFQQWETELTNWFPANPEMIRRLFLLSVAVLENMPATNVLDFAEALRDGLGGVAPQGHDITSPGVRELTDGIGVEPADPSGRLRFRRPAYAAAVIDHFLTDRAASFHEAFRDSLATFPVRRPIVAEAVATAVLGIMRRHRDISYLIPLTNQWAPRFHLRPVLVLLLTAAALSAEIGAPVRLRLYRWAAGSRSYHLCKVVAEVCAGPFADVYPEFALTRIRNLAERETGLGERALVDAVLKLWERPAIRPAVLARLFAWLTEQDSPAFIVGLTAFTRAGTDAIRIARENSLEPGAALCNLFREPDRDERLRNTLYGWLDIAAADPVLADWLIEELAGAVPGTAPALTITSIHVFTRDWQGDDGVPFRSAFRGRLLERITALEWETVPRRRGVDDGVAV